MSFGEISMPSTEHSGQILPGSWPSQSAMAWSGLAMAYNSAANALFAQLQVQHDIQSVLGGMSGAFIDAARQVVSARMWGLMNRIATYQHLAQKAHWASNEVHEVKADLVEIVNMAEENIQTSRHNAELAKASVAALPGAVAAIEAQLQTSITTIVDTARLSAATRDAEGAAKVTALVDGINSWTAPYANSILPQESSPTVGVPQAAEPTDNRGGAQPVDYATPNVPWEGLSQQPLQSQATGNHTGTSSQQSGQQAKPATEQTALRSDGNQVAVKDAAQPKQPSVPSMPSASPATAAPSSGAGSSAGSPGSLMGQILKPMSSPTGSSTPAASSGASPLSSAAPVSSAAGGGMPGGAGAPRAGAPAGGGVGNAGAGGAGGSGSGAGLGGSGRAVGAGAAGAGIADASARMGTGAVAAAATAAGNAAGLGTHGVSAAAPAGVASAAAPVASAGVGGISGAGSAGGAPMAMMPPAAAAGGGVVGGGAAAAAPGPAGGASALGPAAAGAGVPTTAAASAAGALGGVGGAVGGGASGAAVPMLMSPIKAVCAGGVTGDELFSQAADATLWVLQTLVAQTRAVAHIPITWAVSLIWDRSGRVSTWLASSEGPSYIPWGVRIPEDVGVAVTDPLIGRELWDQTAGAGVGDPLAVLARHAELRDAVAPGARVLALGSTAPLGRTLDWAGSLGARAVGLDPRGVAPASATDVGGVLLHRCQVAMPWEWRQANNFNEHGRLQVAARHMRMAAISGHLNGRGCEQVLRLFEERKPISAELWAEVQSERTRAAIDYQMTAGRAGQGGADPEQAFRRARAAEVIATLQHFDTVEGCADLLYAARMAGVPLNPAAAVA